MGVIYAKKPSFGETALKAMVEERETIKKHIAKCAICGGKRGEVLTINPLYERLCRDCVSKAWAKTLNEEASKPPKPSQ